MYWSRAVSRPLNIAPHVEPGDEDALQGPEFLREFEEMRQEKAALTRDGGRDSIAQLPNSLGDSHDSNQQDPGTEANNE